MRFLLNTTLIFVFVLVNACNGQTGSKANKRVGGPCEGCEAIYEYGKKNLTSVDTLPGFLVHEPKLMISGTVYHLDGTTPAEDIILYIYHTNRDGIYETKGNEKGWGRRHGYIRGWIKTGKDGRYTFYTFRPGAYPNRSEPEHIHLIVKEPDKNEYYLDSYTFDDDPLLVSRDIKNPKGGNGIVKPEKDGKLMKVSRNIILGLNIQDY